MVNDPTNPPKQYHDQPPPAPLGDDAQATNQARDDVETAEYAKADGNQLTIGEAIRILGPFGPIYLITNILPFIGLGVVLTYLATLGEFVRGHWQTEPNLTLVGYILAFAVITSVGISPTWVLAVLAGSVFGFAIGCGVLFAGLTISGTISYVIFTIAARDRLITLLKVNPMWHAVAMELIGSGFWRRVGIIILFRNATGWVMGSGLVAAMRIRWVPYIVGSVIGYLPRTIVSVYLGIGIGELVRDEVEGTQSWWLMAVQIACAVTIVIFIQKLAERKLAEITARQQADGQSPGELEAAIQEQDHDDPKRDREAT